MTIGKKINILKFNLTAPIWPIPVLLRGIESNPDTRNWSSTSLDLSLTAVPRFGVSNKLSGESWRLLNCTGALVGPVPV